MAYWPIAMASLLVLAAPGLAQTASPAPRPTETAPTTADSPPVIDELAMLRDRNERVTVPVTIAGSGPYRFFIDTGAQATVVTRRVIDALNLRPSGTALLVAMGSQRNVPTVELDDVAFANRTISGLVTPLLEDDHIGADGILGLDTLQNLRVLIDFRERRMSVTDAHEAKADSGYEIVVRARRRLGQMIITNARVNNVRTAVIIDTGSQNSIGNLALFERLRGRDGGKVVSTDVNGIDLTSQIAFISHLSIDGMDLTDVPIGFTQSPAFAALGLDDKPALILGMSNLRLFDRVAIDFSTRQILFDLPRSAQTSPIHSNVFFPDRSQS